MKEGIGYTEKGVVNVCSQLRLATLGTAQGYKPASDAQNALLLKGAG